jgi:hypothetical protein
MIRKNRKKDEEEFCPFLNQTCIKTCAEILLVRLLHIHQQKYVEKIIFLTTNTNTELNVGQRHDL